MGVSRGRTWPGQGRVGWQTRTWSMVDHSRVDHGAFPTRGEGCGGTIGKGGGVPKRGEDATEMRGNWNSALQQLDPVTRRERLSRTGPRRRVEDEDLAGIL